jgi:HAE1 family hydrophobic/amphiphilic exporter-1
MLFAALVILGVTALTKIPVSLMPGAQFPGLSVVIEYPGNSPEKIESIITKPVEKAIKTLGGIEKIESVSEEGRSRININFRMNVDIRKAALQVREKVNIVRSDFPRDVQEPLVLRFDPTDKPVVIATIDLPGSSLQETREYAERKIKPGLQRIDGISEIYLAGGAQKEIHVDVDRGRFQSRKCAFSEIDASIQNNNLSLPAGRLMSGRMERGVYTAQKFRSARELSEAAIIYDRMTIPIQIGDVADVSQSWREREDYSRYNGEERVMIYIHQAGNVNVLDICNSVQSVFSQEKKSRIKIIYDQSGHIRSALRNILISCLYGSFLICVILYSFFRRMDMVMVIILALPVSILSSFLVIYHLGIELNLMSLSGLSLGGSIIVDNGIVLISAIAENRRTDRSSILHSVAKLKNPLVASTLSTLIVFLPVLMSSEQMRAGYQPLAAAIAIVLMISLSVILILVPIVLIDFQKMKILYPRKAFRANGISDSRTRNIKKAIFAFFDRVGDRYLSLYGRLLNGAMSAPSRIVMICLALLFISGACFSFIKDEFYVYIEFPTGTLIDFTNRAMVRSEELVRSLKITEQIAAKVENWRGTLILKLDSSIDSSGEKKKARDAIYNELSSLNTPLGGSVYLTEADQGNARELDIEIIGAGNDRVRQLAREAAGRISSIRGIENVLLRFREGRPEFRLIVDRGKAGLSYLSSREIGKFVRTALFGPVVSKLVDHDREIDIRMRINPENIKTIDQIKQLSIPNEKGELIPLCECASISEAVGDTRIWRYNGRRGVTITAKIGELGFESAVSRIDSELKKISWPQEYEYRYDDIVKNMKRSRYQMIISLSLSVLLVYMILAAKFESFTVPLVIILAVPLAFVGVVIALFIFNASLNIAVYIGLILLIGIVVNNGIVLVNTVNDRFLSGAMQSGNLNDVIKASALSRVKPVSITAITTILAMLPALLRGGEGSNLWSPLSFTVIAGMIFSYATTLLIVPVFCLVVYRWKIGVKFKLSNDV